MKIKRLELKNFRNYREEKIELPSGASVFLGQNAQGKTNILEAVYYAALGRSHRTSADVELVRWEEREALLSLDFFRMDAENQLEFRFFRESRRKIFRNGAPILMKDLVGTVNVVLFSPEDLLLVKGAPAGRRRFLDMEISQIDPSYFYDLAVYTRLLSQRNTLLKRVRDGEADESEIPLWDVQMIPRAVNLIRKRIEAVKKMDGFASRTHREISGGKENLSLRYELHGADGEESGSMTKDLFSWYNEKLAESIRLDIMRGVTRFGPHRDDLALLVNGADLRSYGSQGQQRTGVLSLKLAELAFFREETGEYPILLLDDVMSELDRDRREKLLSFIRGEKLQALITATDEAYFPSGSFGNFFDVSHGTVTAR
ncbi:MAG: DNA replication/repair protein RecF [Lachnospiraceae bacterium]|nr:DNA replication/repair protein RecF [Lachnospiraceae bacterium]